MVDDLAEGASRLKVCVFCGSSMGHHSIYHQAAAELGRAIAERQQILVYGGGRIGLMGLLADAALAAGGRVIGVIPEFLATKEISHPGVTETYTVSSMHIRKAMMADLADQFIALPGGLGTYDEFCEIATWAQLGLHTKPIGLLNLNGFFDGMIQQIERAVADGFCRAEHRQLFLVDDHVERLLTALQNFRPPQLPKWIGPEQR